MPDAYVPRADEARDEVNGRRLTLSEKQETRPCSHDLRGELRECETITKPSD